MITSYEWTAFGGRNSDVVPVVRIRGRPAVEPQHSTRRIGRTDDDDIAYRERERNSRLLNTAHIQSKHRNLMDRQNPLAITADTLRASRTRCKKGRGRETRNSSGDEIVNVNFIYDDIVHAL